MQREPEAGDVILACCNNALDLDQPGLRLHATHSKMIVLEQDVIVRYVLICKVCHADDGCRVVLRADTDEDIEKLRVLGRSQGALGISGPDWVQDMLCTEPGDL